MIVKSEQSLYRANKATVVPDERDFNLIHVYNQKRKKKIQNDNLGLVGFFFLQYNFTEAAMLSRK